MDSRSSLNQDTIFFDGVCNLCNGAINFVIDRDRNNQFQFASLQSSIAKKVIPQASQSLSTIILVKKTGQIYNKSDAALEISRQMDGAWPMLIVFKILPRFIRDFVYDVIAKNRYKWFGKSDSCRMPSAELKERFLEAS